MDMKSSILLSTGRWIVQLPCFSSEMSKINFLKLTISILEIMEELLYNVFYTVIYYRFDLIKASFCL